MSDAYSAIGSTLKVDLDTITKLTERPLLAVPPELRKPVFCAWAAYRHLTGMETPTSLAFIVSIWINDHGISEQAIGKAMRCVTSPESMKRIKYASDLTTVLAEMVAPHRSSLPYDHIPGVSCE